MLIDGGARTRFMDEPSSIGGRCPGPSGPPSAPTSRREFLCRAGGGLGFIALASLLDREGLLAASAPDGGGRVQPHHPPRAKRVIFLFMSGGPSHLELFDPKPDLVRLNGEKL